ncbi:non-ribosomal peptide synthetase [Taibaiella koreensis]|uniref:non-ribosomal peptide synthetase n=1 Tax=Taibaiella koreensis TaxID=1268548 RepID=UPI000E599B1E|nr:non-ribosomal peptide synthetase [Taibaiella koreensis]
MTHSLQHKIALEYWLEKAERFEPIDIPAIRELKSTDGRGLQVFPFPEAIATSLKERCNNKDAGIYTFAATALFLLLHKYTHQHDLLLTGLPFAAPTDEDDMGAPVFLALSVQRHTDVKTLLTSLQKEMQEAYHHRNYSFQKFEEKVKARQGNGTSLFPFTFSYPPFTREHTVSGQSKLAFALHQTGASFQLEIDHSGHYAGWFIKQLGCHFIHILQFIIRNPTATVAEIPLLSEEERQQIIESFNDTEVAFADKDRSILALFEQQVKETPHQPAVQFGSNVLSYLEVQQKALKLGALLRKRGIGRHDIVALICPRSEHMITGMMGILKAGAAYLPIDADQPDDRIRHILEDSAAKLILTTKAIHSGQQGLFSGYENQVITIDETETEPGLKDFETKHGADDPAYVIYTSGSTGKPKGVGVIQSSFTNFILAYKTLFKKGFDTSDRVLAVSNISFDASIAEIFVALTSGATLVILDKERLLDTAKLATFLKKEDITYAYIPPVLLSDLYTQLRQSGPSTRLRKLLVGVEAIKDTLLYDYSNLIDGLDIINAYGPTETTVIASALNYRPEAPTSENASIGKPMANCRIYILNDYGEPAPLGVAGELCIAGAGVSPGYLNNEALTDAKFVPDPFREEGKMYRSGDLARWTPEGNIMFIGRKDNQVKIRGYRIELGEIESVLRNHSGIKEAVVCAFEEDMGSKYLCAYFVPATEIAVADVRTYLEAQLPEYMIPSRFMPLDKIPITANGKTDRNKLPQPGTQERMLIAEDLPSNGLEEKLLVLWKGLLNLPRISVQDSFFELGGHSLKAAKLIGFILRDFLVEMPLREVFARKSIKNIAAYIQNAETSGSFEIPVAPAAAYYPAAFSQIGIYLSYLINKEAVNFNMPTLLATEGPIDIPRLALAFKTIIKRHSTLRTSFCFRDEAIMQQIEEEVPFSITLLEGEAFATEEAHQALIRPFDLSHPPLLRVNFIRKDEDNGILFIDMHHIISDGVSIDVFIKEIMKCYHGEGLPDLKIQYKDYTVWLDHYRASSAYSVHKKYWLDIFADKPKALDLPIDYPRTVEKKLDGDVCTVKIDKETVSRLKELISEQESTFFILMMAAFQLLLARYTGRKDITVGTSAEGRIHPDLDPLIGMFVHTLPIRTLIKEQQTFRELMDEVKNVFFGALDHQLYPLEELIEQLELTRDRNRNPLFDTLFSYQNVDIQKLQIKEVGLKPLHLKDASIKFDLSVSVMESNEVLWVTFHYSLHLFKQSTIGQMAECYIAMIKAISQSPDMLLQELLDDPALNIPGAKQQERLLTEGERQWLEKAGSCPGEKATKTIIDLLEEQVQQKPDHIAILFKDKAITYAELDRQTDAIAASLQKLGIGAEGIVGIIAERSEWMVIGLIGTLKAGAAYLPIDPGYPRERIDYLLNDSKVAILLTDAALQQDYPGAVSFEEVAAGTAKPEKRTIAPDQLAYVIYTSGTTGRPKGVMMEHQALNNIAGAWRKAYHLDRFEPCLLQMASFAFDVFTGDVIRTLTSGGRMVICPAETRLEVNALYELIRTYQINILESTPALVLPLMDYAYEQGKDLSCLKLLILGSDSCLSAHFSRLMERYAPGIRIVNSYGVTETCIDAGFYETTLDALPSSGNTPIGKPLANYTYYVCDEQQQLVPIGIAGELWIGGAGVARGYLNQPRLTAERFMQHPHNGERVYKTGDLVRWLPDGNLEFIGRNDDQVKLRGYRIELQEIENILSEEEQIKEVAVTVYEDKGEQDLVCWYTSQSGLALDGLRASLKQRLPEHMIPGHFILLNKLPISPNGKIDKKALPDLQELMDKTTRAIDPPETETEARLLLIWQDILKRTHIGVLDNFFEMGGQSLRAMVLVSRIQKFFSLDIALKDVFSHPTIRTLAAYLGTAGTNQFVPIVPIAQQDHYPLSSAQKRLFVISHFKGAETSYNMYSAFWIDGALDIQKLETAFQQLIDRHESLRTAFVMIHDEPVQVIRKQIDFQLKRHKAVETEAPGIVARFIRKFDLETAPLLRAEILEVNPERHLLMYDIHHIISDGVSMRVFMKELLALYQGIPLQALNIQYKDYSAWQQSLFTTGAIEGQKQFWEQQFAIAPPVLDLPADFPRPLVSTFEGDNYHLDLDTGLSTRIADFISARKVTYNMFLLSVFNILLSKYSSQEDIVIGTAVAGRTHADLEPLIGMFVNTLALRNYPLAGKTFDQFLQEVKLNSVHAYSNQDYPFEELVDSLNLKRDTSRNPLFDVMFLFADHTGEQENTTPKEWKISPFSLPGSIAKMDLILEASLTPEKLSFLLNFNTALFTAPTIHRFVTHYLQIVDQVLKRPDITLQQIALPDAAERQLLQAFGGIPEPYAPDVSIPACWKQQVARQPDEMAVITSRGRLSFREMDQLSDALAARLITDYSVKQGDKVAVMQHRTKELMVSLLAILKAGAAYVPVDPLFPAQRIAFILDNSESRLVITDKEHNGIALPILNIHREQEDKPAQPLPEINISASDLAYLIYTSGSTGNPKGVMMEHGNVVSLSENLEPVFGIQAKDRLLALANVTFDMSILDILCSFVSGVCIVLAGDEEVNDFEQIAALIKEQQVTVMQSTPSRLSMLFDTVGSNWLSGIKALLVGGEAMTDKLFHMLRRAGSTRVFNTYGPTETCVWSTAEEIKDDEINIGKPLQGEQILILNTAGQLQPVNVAGEICIAGSGLGKGYCGNDALTAEKFICNEALSPGRIYRTGDAGKWLPDGRIAYIGRLDNQVKLRGYRIELGEIENVLSKMEGVEMTAAVITDINGAKEIAAFYECDRKYSYATVRAFLADRLPSYMLPLLCIYLDKLPLTSSGKIDRIALEQLAQQQQALSRPHEEPAGALQQQLATIWKVVLHTDIISASDNFFEIGGNSIKLIQVLNKIKKEMGMTVPLTTAFTYPTIKELSAKIKMIREFGNVSAEEFYSLVNPGKPQYLFCFPPAIGYSFIYTALAEYLPDYTLCCFHYVETEDRAAQYLKVINELQPDQPLLLLGYSAGGNFAFEMAKEFEAAGSEVSDIILIDSYKYWKPVVKTPEQMEETIRSYFETIDWSLFSVDPGYLEDLKKTTLNKITGYCKHADGKIESGQTNARIHLLRSIEEWDTPEVNRLWEESSTTACHVYQGSGIHMEMLHPEYLSQNVGLIATILQSASSVGNVRSAAFF